MTKRVLGVVLAVLAGTLLVSCGSTKPPSPPGCTPAHPLAAGTTEQRITSGGIARTYLRHVPAGYDGRTRVPVIVLFHGFGGNADATLRVTRMDQLADRKDVIVLAPQGAGLIPSWNYRDESDDAGSDMAFAHEVVDRVKDVACIDADRVYAAGFSNGSALTLALACEDSRVFAAFGAVAAPYYSSRCDRAPPRSLIYFHGTDDIVVPYSGAKTIIGTLPGVIDALTSWAAHDACRRNAHTTAVSKHVERYRWTGCMPDQDVSAYVVAGGGHQWPGGIDGTQASSGSRRSGQAVDPIRGVMTREIDATALMWAFFAAHPR